MKRNTIQLLIFLQFFLFVSCFWDYAGNLFIVNGYDCPVIARTFYDYNTIIIENSKEFLPGLSYPLAATSHQYDNIIAIQLETQDGNVFTNYTPEYLMLLRRAYKRKKITGIEEWIFTEKGLFLMTKEIRRKYKWDYEKILSYYRSDEAVHDLRELLEKVAQQ